MSVQDAWLTANQRVLTRAVREVRGWLAGTPTPEAAPDPALEGSALGAVASLFKLSPFECQVLVMCAAPELDGAFEMVPSFAAALASLPGAHWSAALPTGPLRWWRLVQPGTGSTLVGAPLRIDECILHALAGLPCTDERLGGSLHAVAVPEHLPPSQAEAAAAVALRWQDAPAQLHGPDSELQAVAAAAAASLGRRLWCAPAAALLGGGGEEWFRLWQRQALLLRAALLVDCNGHDDSASLQALAATMRGACTPLLLAHADPIALPGFSLPRMKIERPRPAEQADLWHRAFGEPDEAGSAEIDRVAAHFDFGVSAIAATAHVAGTVDRLWASCREQARGDAGQVSAENAVLGWDDLALPPNAQAMLRDMAAQMRNRRMVHETWGFSETAPGITALFHGPSGTGKSFAARIVADVLGLDVCRVDLSQVVSKYIGETEKQLARLFDTAEASGAILLFDEADALFGRRTEVRDSHDRYANLEVSYLLARMEAYRGLAILTTNMRDCLDTAFLRRIRFIVAFPHPGPEERARLWGLAFPQASRCDGLDHARLAQANLTGGQIRNVALGAAFLAAEEGVKIGMSHVMASAKRECAKVDRPLTQTETDGWL